MKAEILTDPVARSVTVGALVFKEPMLLDSTTWPSIRAKVAQEFKLANTDAGVGVAFKNELKRAFKRIWLDPYREDILSSCTNASTGLVEQAKLATFWSNLESIESTKELNIEHLQPWIVEFKKSPTELRKHFGKSNWKAMREMSYEETETVIRLVKFLGINHNDVDTIGALVKSRDSWHLISQANEALNDAGRSLDLKLFAFINTVIQEADEGGPYAHRFLQAWIRHEEAEYANTELGMEYNFLNMGPRRYQEVCFELQRRLQRQIRLKDYPETLPGWGHAPKEFQTEVGVAKLLDSPFEIMLEGERMEHCIAGYVDQIVKGNYLAYHIITNNGEHFTLGLRASAYEVQDFGQLQGKANRGPKNGHARAIADRLLDKLTRSSLVDKMIQESAESDRVASRGGNLGERMAQFLKSDASGEAQPMQNRSIDPAERQRVTSLQAQAAAVMHLLQQNNH